MAEGKVGPQVAVVIGSDSDLDVIECGLKVLDELGITYQLRILSAHRTPAELSRYIDTLEDRGVKVVIAAAGLSAALPGVISAQTVLPVVGVPVNTGALGGVDALLSMSQMPPGVPVGTVTIGSAGAKNAAILASRIIAVSDKRLAEALRGYIDAEEKKVLAEDRRHRTK